MPKTLDSNSKTSSLSETSEKLNELNDVEKRVYEVIKNITAAQGPIPQTKLKELPELRGISPQQIAKTVLKLSRLGLIRRQRITKDGRSMYVVSVTTIEQPPQNFVLPIRLDFVIRIPCFKCKELERCTSGSYYNPQHCSTLTEFLRSIIKKSSKE